jgi:hypothetical protein
VRRHHAQCAFLAVGLEVDPPHQVLAGQDGQAVVAVDALGRGLEDLEQGVEAEEAGHARAVPQQRIER